MSDEFSLVNAGMSLAFVIYSLFVIVVGMWGHSILPRSCSDPDVRSNLRGLLVSGFMSLVAFIGYSMCNLICVTKEKLVLPTWLVFFIFGLSLANLIMVGQLQTAMSNSSVCRTTKYDSYKQILTFFSVLSGMTMGISFIGLLYRGYEYQTTLKGKAGARLEQIELQDKRQQDQALIEGLKKQISELEAENSTEGERKVLEARLRTLQSRKPGQPAQSGQPEGNMFGPPQ